MLHCTDPQKALTKLEKDVVDYLNYQVSDFQVITITDVADSVFVSAATVSRAIRKCGFPNFNAACFHLDRERQENLHQNYMNTILSKAYEECTRTINSIEIDQMEKAVEFINAAPRILLLARGQTRLIAEDFCFQLQCLKYNAAVMSDANIMRKIEYYAHSRDLIFLITVQNSTPELFIAAKALKKMGCRIITICCKEGTPLETVSDIMIRGYSLPITPNITLDGMSRVPLMLITRTISEYLSIRKN